MDISESAGKTQRRKVRFTSSSSVPTGYMKEKDNVWISRLCAALHLWYGCLRAFKDWNDSSRKRMYKSKRRGRYRQPEKDWRLQVILTTCSPKRRVHLGTSGSSLGPRSLGCTYMHTHIYIIYNLKKQRGYLQVLSR